MRKPATDQIKELAASVNASSEARRKRPRMTPWSKLHLTMTTILALTMLSPTPTKAETNISITYPSPGLYLEELGEIALNRGQVRLDINLRIADMAKDKANAQKHKYARRQKRPQGTNTATMGKGSSTERLCTSSTI
jgi:hypothetical protein